ncbi:sugar phosphate isomerase/epimerase family protein [Lunatimonas salinarum]|uniref:sugar phosphate isomerase/epimerase family protein n=1 Tax=Lunatimonas salinarum TaxID=1774590 RepID=UPI001AE0D480|nr:sugar phosphate isomerase/epimerase [Lunatimonas salinarum]
MSSERTGKLGIFSKTFSGSPDRIFQKAKLLGFDGLHYNMVSSGLPSLPISIPPFKVDEISMAKSRYHLDLCGLSATFNLIHPDHSVREAGFTALEVLSAVAFELKIPMITLCTGTHDPTDMWKWHPENKSRGAWLDLISMMERCIQVAEKYGVKLGVEPEFGNVVHNAVTAKKLLNELRSPVVEVIFDPANLFATADSSEEVSEIISHGVELLGSSISVAHLKDKGLNGMYAPLGMGAIDFSLFLKKLDEINFSGPFIIHGITEAQVPESLNFIRPLLEQIRNTTIHGKNI